MAKKEAKNLAPTLVNRKASHEYHFVEKFVAGIQLVGTEVKSVREGKVQMQDAYCVFEQAELFVKNMQISPYGQSADFFNHEPMRKRKLLLTARELKRLEKGIQETGVTIIPVRLFFSERGLAKLEIALARGKKLFDKRETIKEREVTREMQRNLKD
ncbi:MAG: SsrA-binding protein SmpB [Bacteroidetes bacterium]|nr:SsrA-binding protein SmpB [Bacteroidota bacterium]